MPSELMYNIFFVLARKLNVIKNIVLAIMLELSVISSVLVKNVKIVIMMTIKWISRFIKAKNKKITKIY